MYNALAPATSTLQATAWLHGELARPQGLLPEGILDGIVLLVCVWGFGEMEGN